MKKQLLITLLMFICISKITTAQVTFQETIGSPSNDDGNFVRQTNDGGYIIAGDAYDFIAGSNADAYIIKTDGNGILQWSKTYGGTNDETATCIQQTADGGYIICGRYSLALNSYRGFLIKTNSSGDTVWTKQYGIDNNVFYSVKQTTDGGYIAVGGHYDAPTSSAPFMVRVASDGSVLWAKEYLSNNAGLNSVVQSNDGGFVACGVHGSAGAMFLLKVNSAGDTVISKTLNGWNAKCINKTSDGGYIIGGGNITTNTGSVIKIDASGNTTWNHTFGTSSMMVNSVQQTTNGEYIATINAGLSYPYILKLGTTGNFISCRQYQPVASNSQALCLNQTSDGGIVFVGQISSGGNDIYLAKADSNGIGSCNNVTFLMSGITQLTSSGNIPNTIISDATSSPLSIFVNSVTSAVSTLCTTVGINEPSNNNLFSIYPNPTSGQFTILLTTDNATISVTDLLGQQILKTQATQKTTNLQLDNNGVYIVYVTTKEGTTTRKLVVSR